jgi:hypothetical protein
MEPYVQTNISEAYQPAFSDIESLVTKFQKEASRQQQSNLPLLLSVHSHTTTKLLNKIISTLSQLDIKEEDKNVLITEWNITKNLTLLQQKDLFIARAKDRGLICEDGENQLINPLPTPSVPADSLKSECPESALRQIPTFSGKTGESGNSIDLICEEFLQACYSVGRVQNLSEEALKGIIFRKLTEGARLLISTHLAALNQSIDELSVKTLVFILESQYMANLLSPLSCLRELHAIPRIKRGSYLESIGQICRLARLSSRLEADEERKRFLTESRSLECFRNSLEAEDQQVLNIENHKRSEQGHANMTALKSARYLQQCYLAKQNERSASDIDSINKISEEDIEVNYIKNVRGGYNGISRGNRGNKANFNREGYSRPMNPSSPRGGNFQGNSFRGTRGQQFNTRGRGQGRPMNRGGYTSTNRGGHAAPYNRGGYAAPMNRGGYSAPNQFRSNNQYSRGQNQNMRGQNYRGQNHNNRGQYQNRGQNQGKRYPTAADLNVSPGCCFLCGGSHNWHQKGGAPGEINNECPYKESHRGPPRNTPCHRHNPNKFGHHPAVCLGDLSVRQIQNEADEFDINGLFNEEGQDYQDD